MSDSYKFDAIIIGAGIVGLAVADKLREKFDSILLVKISINSWLRFQVKKSPE